MTSILRFPIDTAPMFECRELLLGRGIAWYDLNDDAMRLYLMVTRAGSMTARRAPLPVAQEVQDAILIELEDLLERIDPHARLIERERRPTPPLGPASLRALARLGLKAPEMHA